MILWRDVIVSFDMCLFLWDVVYGDKNWNEVNVLSVFMF